LHAPSLSLLPIHLQALANRTSTPLVVVLIHGGPLDISDMQASPRVGAVLTAWHPGQYGSTVVADIIFGKTSPSGAWLS